MSMLQRISLLSLALGSTLLVSACVITPHSVGDASAHMNKMSEQAQATCGAGQVKEVNAKSFSCK
ncbi:hypothetical protein QWZ02_16430 [Kinneretia asaccharophila]|uniref:Lipoprotein n=1 Tax=Roseateles asaccharophilus TaxID=582607 RepID=A0A4R6N809_9BURK|nr:hypothetical protein [Roseateles asaccharophilus]MDN3546047.1 hypothetical protein [Roseateles asaccharophilus]TDP11224.1 hypothetical protein DFR39_103149 [Roseateles asaccharophilus]